MRVDQDIKLAIGVDLVDVGEFVRAVNLTHGLLLDACFSRSERVNAYDRPESLAIHYAAKEAVSKALGVGMLREIGWRDIELVPTGRLPKIELFGCAAAIARAQKWCSWSISVSRERNLAIAMIVALKHNMGGESKHDTKISTGREFS